ncbi:hypothetical protein [Bradyrhizobium sp. LHD-71]|uniref:hypothetical protein n=1 Tax=Bradyrhizobium sp. LHD-71 TaxID=3072141 RepID=UPI00280FDB4F|nr:hypothetical protein [Bradyrhizobium sp. LHD-71]MDQ8729728.1 hypothetical protein [Bradyrhizobium sp. LHD-71]
MDEARCLSWKDRRADHRIEDELPLESCRTKSTAELFSRPDSSSVDANGEPFAQAIITAANRVELDIAHSGNRYTARIATGRRGLSRLVRTFKRIVRTLIKLILRPLRPALGVLAEYRIHQAALRQTSRH